MTIKQEREMLIETRYSAFHLLDTDILTVRPSTSNDDALLFRLYAVRDGQNVPVAGFYSLDRAESALAKITSALKRSRQKSVDISDLEKVPLRAREDEQL